MTKTKGPDIRLHSMGMAEAYGLRPLSEAGAGYVGGFADRTKGRWHDGVFWFHESLLPRDALIASGLEVVAGIGDTDAHDLPWPDPYVHERLRNVH